MLKMKKESLCRLDQVVRGNYGKLVHKGLMGSKLKRGFRRGQQVFELF